MSPARLHEGPESPAAAGLRPDTDGPALLHVTECLASGTLSFLVLATRELARAGARQCLLFSRRPDTPARVEQLFDPSVELVELPALTARSLPTYARSLRAALRERLANPGLSAVHLHSSKAGFVGRWALRGLPGPLPPVFYSPHGLAYLDDSSGWKPYVFRGLEQLAARLHAATPVGCGRGEAALLDALGGPRARLVENAIPADFFGLQHQPCDPPVVLSLGRVCYQKAPERFAELARRMDAAPIPARFVWVGAGDPEAEARLRAAGVEVTGWLDGEAVRRWLASASVYVQTSRWEGLSVALLQALGAGIPCVVSDVVGNRDAVRPGLTGFVCADQDALRQGVEQLLQDRPLRERMSLAARADAIERFGPDGFRARLCRLYGIEDARPQPVSAGGP